jgi:hypothetical protein
LESLKNGLYLFFYTIYKYADIQNLNSIPGKKNGPDLGDLRPLHTGPAQIRREGARGGGIWNLPAGQGG